MADPFPHQVHMLADAPGIDMADTGHAGQFVG
ncbi:hypothetical protein BSY17_2657 [Sphingobium sp. RAC03]|nr:hypothetical protein BSY17_2657 [Sphingobium sp. RAC03]